jgi:hypothetical protein
MTRSEYEQRRRALEAQLAADVELVRAAHETRLRALERLWLASSEVESSEPVPIGTQTGNGMRTETGTQTGTQAPPAEDEAVHKGYGEVAADLEDALVRLPELFDKAALVHEIGYQPIRSTLHRAIDKLLLQKKIKVDQASSGRTRTIYRKERNQEQAGT